MASPAISQSPTSFTAHKTISALLPRPRTASETTKTDSEEAFNSVRAKRTPSLWSSDDPFAPRLPTPVQMFKRDSAVAARPTTTLPLGIAAAPGNGAKKQRMSLLLTASDSLFSFASSTRRSNSVRKPPPRPIKVEDETPVVDIRAMTEEEAEREALRNEAAKSLGLGWVVEQEEQQQQQQQQVHNDETSVSLSFGDSAVQFSRKSSVVSGSLSPSIDHTTFLPSSLAAIRSSDSSAVSLNGGEPWSSQPPSQPNPAPQPTVLRTATAIPNFPASISSLVPFVQTSFTLLRHYSGGSFFTSKARQWKSRHLVLTSLKPPNHLPDNTVADTQAHLHLFRSSAPDEKEIERLKIDEDSVVFVVDEGAEVAGRKNVIKVGGLHAGGMTNTNSKDVKKRPIPTLASINVMGSSAMVVSMGGPTDAKVLWLLQCPGAKEAQECIRSVKAALLVQRAERSGLAMSLQTAPADIRLTGDLDVLLSLRAQGLLPSPASSPSPQTVTAAIPSSTLNPLTSANNQDSSFVAKGGRSRSSTTTTNPSSAVNALRGLFSSGVANGLISGSSLTRPRSLSASPPASPLVASPLTLSSALLPTPETQDDPKTSSFGNRPSALLDLGLQRATNSHLQPSSSSLLLSQSIRDSISVSHDDSRTDEVLDGAGKLQRERNRLCVHVSYSSYERPTSASSLPPPPRTKRLGSVGGNPTTPRTPIMEQSLQEELMKGMLAPVRGMHARRGSEDTVAEEAISPMTRNSLEGRARVSLDSAVDRLVPFPLPGWGLGSTPMQFCKSSASLGPDARPTSALSNVSTTSFQQAGGVAARGVDESATPSPSPVATSKNSPPSPISKRLRRVPKILAPPSGPPPAPPAASRGDSLYSGDTPSPSKDRVPVGTSFFSTKRISAGSTGLSSLKSFASGSSSSRSNSLLRSSAIYSSPRPPPPFAVPPTPGLASSETIQSFMMLDGGVTPELPYTGSVRSQHRNSNSSVSPSRTDFNARPQHQHRITPPSVPPPNVALPPRPDGLDAPGSVRLSAQTKTGSCDASGLSTIPASPVGRLSELPNTTTRTKSTPSASPSRHSSLKSRLRMLSTPSPQPPTTALPPVPASTGVNPQRAHASTMVPKPPVVTSGRARSWSNTVDPILPLTTEALDRSIATLEDALPASTPPIPPRSQARPQSPRISETLQRTLSPPPRRNSRQSRDLRGHPGVPAVERLDVASVSEQMDVASLSKPMVNGL